MTLPDFLVRPATGSRPRRSNEAKARQYFGEENGTRTPHSRRPRGPEVNEKNGGATFLGLGPEVQPTTAPSPQQVESPFVDACGDVRKAAERHACTKKQRSKDEHPHAGQLEADELFGAVGQQVTEEIRGVEVRTLQPMPRGCGESPCSPLGSGSTLSGLLIREAPLVLPERRGELKCEVGVVAIEIE